MKFSFFFTIAIIFSSPPKVSVSGEMRRIMQHGDLRATISLDSLSMQSHLYGIGVMEELQGEIIIIDGKPYVSAIENGAIKTNQTFNIKAALLVYCQVDDWSSQIIQRPVSNLLELQNLLEKLSKQQNIDTSKPFPFRIKATKGVVNYHIINWKDGVEHTPTNHKQFAKDGKMVDEDVTLLGFYSDRHQGIFTHHDTKIHLHVINKNLSTIGHVDAIEWPNGFEIEFSN